MKQIRVHFSHLRPLPRSKAGPKKKPSTTLPSPDEISPYFPSSESKRAYKNADAKGGAEQLINAVGGREALHSTAHVAHARPPPHAPSVRIASAGPRPVSKGCQPAFLHYIGRPFAERSENAAAAGPTVGEGVPQSDRYG